MLKVINGYRDGFIGENKIYIGRKHYRLKLDQSILHNPFLLGFDGDRAEVCRKYKIYLWLEIKNKQGELWDYLFELAKLSLVKDIELSCFCKPQACHGDVIIDCINWIVKEYLLDT